MRMVGILSKHCKKVAGQDIEIHRLSGFDERFDTFWKRAAKEIRVAVIRDCQYLNWRYIDKPLGNYVILSAAQGKELLGFCVVEIIDTPTSKTAAIVELLVLPEELQAGYALLSKACLTAKENNCWQIQCWMLPEHKRYTNLLKHSGFVFFGNRLFPSLLRYTTSFIIRTNPGIEYIARHPESRELVRYNGRSRLLLAMRILMYHEIVADQPHEIHAVSVDQFTAQMYWLHQAGYTTASFDFLSLSSMKSRAVSTQKSIIITFDDGYLDNFTNALPVLDELNFRATLFITSGFLDSTSKWREGPFANTPMLNRQQVREMDQMGMQIGSHSLSHPDLTRLPLKILEWELHQSRDELEQVIGKPVDTFAYPYSRYNKQTIEFLKVLRYQLACTYNPGYVGLAGSKQFELQKMKIIATNSIKDFQMKVRGSPIRLLAQYLRKFEKNAQKLCSLRPIETKFKSG